MRVRTKNFSLDAIQIFKSLPKAGEGEIIGKQFLRSALSVGSNYRAVCRARSKAEFYAKLSITIEETDEALFWMEILKESGIAHQNKFSTFEKEGTEILAILSTARKHTK
jgi:four helix bundle protein